MKLKMKLSKSVRSLLNNFFLGSVSLDALESSLTGSHHSYLTLAESISTSDSLNMNFLPEARALQSQTYTTPNIFTLNLHSVCFCPFYNILHTQSHQIIEESISTQRDLDQFDFKMFYRKDIDQISGFCSTYRSHKNGYYHTLIDNLPRLYLLHHPRFQELDKIQILCSSKLTRVEQFYLNKLLTKNAQVVLVDQDKQYIIDNLIFPSFLTQRFSGYLPTEYRNWFIKKVTPKRLRCKVNRIFISRIATHKGRQRCILNETELFNSLQSYGFKRYVLEQLTIEDQIALFYDAEIVVAAHGAGLANIIFSQEIKLLELFPTTFVLPHYYFLSKSLGHNYKYWCGQAKGKYDNFDVEIPEIVNILESFLSP